MKNKKLKTALIIGRWQPWHKGHRELFKAALDRAHAPGQGPGHFCFFFHRICEAVLQRRF